MEPELIVNYECECGENPLWHPLEKKLYWVDIIKGRIFRYDPATGKSEMCYEIYRWADLLSSKTGRCSFSGRRAKSSSGKTGKQQLSLKSCPENTSTASNDVIADPMGRVFCGTYSAEGKPGRLYRLDTDGKITKLLNNIGCSNGMGLRWIENRCITPIPTRR